MTTNIQMGQTKALINAYFPLLAAVVIIGVLHMHVIKGWGLNLSLLLLVGSELGLMVRQRQGNRDSELVEALMIGPPLRTRDEALALAHLPRIAVEIFATWITPRHGDLALAVLFVALFIENMTLFINGGEIVTGEVRVLPGVDT